MKEVTQILTDLRRKIFKPIYFLSGEESYYIDLISDYIEKNVLDESEQEFNQTILYGKEADMNTIIAAAKRFPMMSEYQVIIIKEAQNLKELGKSSGSDDDDDNDTVPTKSTSSSALSGYLQHPQASTILVFCYKYKTLDKRSAVYKSLQKNHVFLETKKLYDNKIPEWISEFVNEKKYKINIKTSTLLAESLGNDLSKIANEVDKLFINLKEGEEITIDAVQEKIGISKDFNVFELQDAIAKKDILKANKIMYYFAANEKEHPAVMTLSSLYGYFTKVLLYHFAPDKNKFSVAQILGVNPFFVDGYIKAAQNYNTAKLKSIFGFLKEYDLKTKGVDNSGVNSGELMKEMMFKILHV